MQLAQVERRHGEDRQRRRPQRAPRAGLTPRHGGQRNHQRDERVGEQTHADGDGSGRRSMRASA